MDRLKYTSGYTFPKDQVTPFCAKAYRRCTQYLKPEEILLEKYTKTVYSVCAVCRHCSTPSRNAHFFCNERNHCILSSFSPNRCWRDLIRCRCHWSQCRRDWSRCRYDRCWRRRDWGWRRFDRSWRQRDLGGCSSTGAGVGEIGVGVFVT